jgi:hypothetical protein
VLSRLGWRVGELAREEEELALQCVGLLASELIFPVSTFTRGGTGRAGAGLWMEVSIHTSAESKDFLFLNRNAP